MNNNIPAELKYVASYEWLRLRDDGMITVGAAHHTQELLGDIVFVEPPGVGTNLAAEEQTGVVESAKATSDAYVPTTGKVIAVNEDLPSASETVNSAPYGVGWFFKIRPANPADYDGLLAAEQYAGEAD